MAGGDPDWLAAFLAQERLPPEFAETVERLCVPLAAWIAGRREALGRGVTVGLSGAQGGGKSTVAAAAARLLRDRGLAVAVLSLDDLYLDRSDRLALAERVHPLFRTRGPPGTHDPALGERVLDALATSVTTAIPRFDKAEDGRLPPSEWTPFQGPADVVLFEGWCVGAAPQTPAALSIPINALERRADEDGVWRGYANAALAGPYHALFARLDGLVYLRPPDFETVLGWRTEQERKLRARLAEQGRPAAHAMSDAEVAGFVQVYERLTRHMMATTPRRADVVVRQDRRRRPITWRERQTAGPGDTN
ncbi:kinase [Caulobacter sp. CCUG 60055]|uniref:kinase n=1 Tax=Caulobacter sp. CCUG 60055 TaxID=2100090 RepID=UPI001FA7DD46|nr:kinase [Caulobacter sp. CCUG 60055]MBQ1540865.1 kinase [Caulobacteraceae bacterium]MCI3179266.1 kinase [Caulobacter sp. CCUG 60055]